MIKREKIPGLTSEQAADELVFIEFERILRKAKKKVDAARAAEQEVFKALEDMCIDANRTETAAELTDNLREAITCFLSYGKYSFSGIMREVREAYVNQEEKN